MPTRVHMETSDIHPGPAVEGVAVAGECNEVGEVGRTTNPRFVVLRRGIVGDDGVDHGDGASLLAADTVAQVSDAADAVMASQIRATRWPSANVG